MDKNQTEPISDELEEKRREFQNEIAHKKPAKSAKKFSKKKLILGLTLLGLLLVSLIIAAAYVLWFSPERAVSDAIVRALGSQTVTFTGSIEGGKTLDVQFNGASAGSQGAKLSFNTRLSFNNNTNAASSDMILDKDGNIYMSAGGIKNALGNDLVADAGNQGSYANLLLQKLEGKWLKITSTELEPYNKKIAAIQSCVESVIKKNQGNGPVFQESADIYLKNRFILVDSVAGQRGTSTGYNVHVDKDRLKAFLGEFKTTELYRQLHDCDSGAFDVNVDQVVTGITRWTNNVVLWINQSHEITEIDSNGSFGNLQTDLKINPLFNQEAKIIVPSSTVSMTQLHGYLVDGTQALALAKKSDPVSKQLLDGLKAKLQTSQ